MEELFSTRDYIRVMLLNARVDVQVGMHPWERHPERPTRLKITVELFAPLADGHATGTSIVDYDHVRLFILQLSKRPHIELLETLVDDVVRVCFLDTKVSACRVQILKPDIFNEADGAGIEVFRTRRSWSGA